MKTHVFTTVLLLISLTLSATAAPLPVDRIPSDTFSSFVKNWDEAKVPVLCALIRDQAGWDGVFGTAAFKGNKKPFAPAAATWKQHQILVVSHVMPAPADGGFDKAFAVQSIDDDGKGTLTVRYTFTPAKQNTSTVKNPMLLKIPRKDYTRVVFIESGKTIGELGPGAWVKPEPTP